MLALGVPALVLGEFQFGRPRAPEITAGPFVVGRSLDERAVPLTIGITNKFGTPVSIAFDHNAGGPPPIGGPHGPVNLGASSTQFTFPTGWAGQSQPFVAYQIGIKLIYPNSRTFVRWQDAQ